MKSDYCPHCGTLFDMPETEITFGNMTLTDRIYVEKVEYLLAPTAIKMLRVLFLRKLATREAIFAAVWGGDSEVDCKIVQQYICRLRRLLKAFGADFEIVTEWGIGYKLRPI